MVRRRMYGTLSIAFSNTPNSFAHPASSYVPLACSNMPQRDPTDVWAAAIIRAKSPRDPTKSKPWRSQATTKASATNNYKRISQNMSALLLGWRNARSAINRIHPHTFVCVCVCVCVCVDYRCLRCPVRGLHCHLAPKVKFNPPTHTCVCGTYRLILEATDDFAAPGKASFATMSPKSVLISPHLRVECTCQWQ